MKQWVNGAALHIHTFLHWKRLTDPSAGEVLSLDYLHGLDPLVESYGDYLLGTVLVYKSIYDLLQIPVRLCQDSVPTKRGSRRKRPRKLCIISCAASSVDRSRPLHI